jgi:hypothetical protein
MSACKPVARTTALLFATCACAAHAWRIDYSLEAALGFSDNLNQSQDDPISQAMLIPRLDFDLREEGAALRVHAAGQVEYRDYLQGDFSNEFRGRLSGLATWIILPQRINFDFEDYAAVEPVDVLAANTPTNQQQTNVFSLGPTFNFHLQPTLDAQAELRLSNSTASKTKEFNSNRVLAAARALKELNPTDVLSANAEATDVHFTDRSGGPDYRRYDVFARYQSKLSDVDLDIAAGSTRLNFAPGDSHSGPLGRGKLTWRVTPTNSLAFAASRQFSDASQDLIVDPVTLTAVVEGSGVVVGRTPINSQVYVEKRADLAYVYQSVRLGARVAPYVRRLDYVLDPLLDQHDHGVLFGFSYRPRPLWTLALDATEETRDYQSVARRDRDRRYDLSFSDRLARQWSVRADLIRNERRSTLAQQSFRENIAFFTVIYTR